MNPPIPFLAAPGYPATQQWIAALQEAMPGERIVTFSQLNDADKAACTLAIVANPSPADLKQLPELRWVHSVWAGVERLVADLKQTQAELKIVRLIDPQLAETMAEAVLAWTLYLHRDMPSYIRQQRQKRWQPLPAVRAQERTVGLLGMGVLGEAAAQRLHAANFKVRGWSRERKALANVECFAGAAELQSMLAATDILICLLPLTEHTTGLLNAQTLGWLPAGASLINFARGPIIDDAALSSALDSGHIDHAVLDVFAVEPLPQDQWQWTHPQVLVLPHCSAPTHHQTASAIVASNIQAFRSSGLIPASVDTQAGY